MPEFTTMAKNGRKSDNLRQCQGQRKYGRGMRSLSHQRYVMEGRREMNKARKAAKQARIEARARERKKTTHTEAAGAMISSYPIPHYTVPARIEINYQNMINYQNSKGLLRK